MLRGRGLSYAMAYKTNVRALWYRCARLFYVDSCSDFGCYLHLYRLGYLFSFLLAVWCIWRIFSRNISRRYAENQKFMQVFSPVQNMIVSKISGARDLKTHRHFRCPSCKQKIRVPRGRGKIQITCPKCGQEFIKKS